MRKGIGISIIISLLLTICGCSVNRREVNLAICGSFAVPGMFCHNLKGDTNECVILEEDSYGRILYTYTTRSVITDQEETAVLICQNLASTEVYYYKDTCYLIGEWTDDELKLLKEKNDWEKPLNEDKMSSASNKTTLDNCIASSRGKLEYQKVQESCYETLGISDALVVDFCILDTCDRGAEIYWLVVNSDTGEECYFMRVEPNYSVSYLATERTLDALNDLLAFKQAVNA